MTETIATEPEKCIFVDTNYLRAVPHPQRSEWEKLLLLSRQRKIKIYVSYIAREEWRTGRRDVLIAERARTLSALRDLRMAAQADLLKDELKLQVLPEDLFPSVEDIDAASQSGINKFIEENNIIVIEPTHQHQMKAWGKYFSWEPPFQVEQDHNRHVKTSDKKQLYREGRKTHLPDAWIGEAARELHNTGHEIIFLGGDGNLNSSLKGTNISFYQDIRDVLPLLNIEVEVSPLVPSEVLNETAVITLPPAEEIIQATVPHVAQAIATAEEVPLTAVVEPVIPQAPIPAQPEQGAVAPPEEFPPGNDLDAVTAALEGYDKAERGLQIRVLGYVDWTAPTPKKQLTELLIRKNFEADHIRSVAERLCRMALLEDTGSSYTPKNTDICRAARLLVLNEIDEALNV